MEFLGSIQKGDVVQNSEGKRVFKFKYHDKLIEVGLDQESVTFKDQFDIEAFLYSKEKEEFVASFKKPLIALEEMASLEVVQVVRGGAFLNWGLCNDLFLPKSEMVAPLEEGDHCLVKLCHDFRNGRLIAVSKVEEFLTVSEGLREGDSIDCMAYKYSGLGLRVIVNKAYSGMIYEENLTKKPEVGSSFEGFVNKVREDGKLDVLFKKAGIPGLSQWKNELLQLLNDNDGFLPLNDKSDPEEVKRLAAMSKKVFKKVAGMLYKEGKIEITETGIKFK